MMTQQIAPAQAPAAAPNAVQDSAPVLRTETQLVLVDVTVKDKSGRPVRGLKREDFTVEEDKQPQDLRNFEEHSNAAQQAGSAIPPLPAGTFTNYTPVPHGALNVLLLDALNTPLSDQFYLRDQLLKFVNKAAPGTRIAIFGLAQNLYLLQGFSTDPQVLKYALEHKGAHPRSSSFLPGADAGRMESQSETITQSTLPALAAQTIAILQRSDEEVKQIQTQNRVQDTLDAFNALAHYLSAFPGRKNLIWFSGSFPIALGMDASDQTNFKTMLDNGQAFFETSRLLASAQIAVYPVDARGLAGDLTMTTAGASQKTVAGFKPAAEDAGLTFGRTQAQEHQTMALLAEQTGGTAFYDTNDLTAAVESAIDSGANYYTVAYSPARNAKKGYRSIHVKLNGSLESAGYKLNYRRGYESAASPDATGSAATGTGAAAKTDAGASANGGAAYARRAMEHGAPEPQEIVFKARVLPVGTDAEPTLAADNAVDPAHPMKPPFRRFAVDIAVVGGAFHLAPQADGHRTGAISFRVMLYDHEGKLLNLVSKNVQLNLTEEQYKQLLSGVHAHFEISAPVDGPGKLSGDSLRIGVCDLATNRVGAVEIPLASVAQLTPLPAAQPVLHTR